MGKTFDIIDEANQAWIQAQKVFFVATAPTVEHGHVNCSPKGMDTLRVLGPRTIAYLDYVGSGVETIAHLQDNGRIVIMLCAFDGPPRIMRFHGKGRAVLPGDPEFGSLEAHFPPHEGTRAIIVADLDRITDSCGYGVPLMSYRKDRDVHVKWCRSKGPEGLHAYQQDKNLRSIDGLPGIPPDQG